MKTAKEMKEIYLNASELAKSTENFFENCVSQEVEKIALTGHRYIRVLLTSEVREQYYGGWIFTEEEILNMWRIKFENLGYGVSDSRTKNTNGLKVEW
jgi:hypothetical protein